MPTTGPRNGSSDGKQLYVSVAGAEPEPEPDDPDATSTVVGASVDVVVDVVVVGQSPRTISSSFVAAPVMHVPSAPLVLSALLHPQVSVQSLPHLMMLQGSTGAMVVAVDVVVDVSSSSDTTVMVP